LRTLPGQPLGQFMPGTLSTTSVGGAGVSDLLQPITVAVPSAKNVKIDRISERISKTSTITRRTQRGPAVVGPEMIFA
jgi:hypothetical protein